MEKKSRAFILPAAAAVTALISIAVRIILTLTDLDVKYGVYKRGKVLPTIYHIILALVCLAFIVIPLAMRKKLGVPEIPKVGDLSVFASLPWTWTIRGVQHASWSYTSINCSS